MLKNNHKSLSLIINNHSAMIPILKYKGRIIIKRYQILSTIIRMF
jgi:hypothetical protein